MENPSNSLPNFPLLFNRIAHYLMNATENPEELVAARKALAEIHQTIYGTSGQIEVVEVILRCPSAALYVPPRQG